MGIVVFLVGPPPCELDLLRLAVVVQVLVDELRAIVGVDAPERKGQGLAELGEGRLDRALALAEHGGGLDPGGVDVGEVEGVHELALAQAAAMRHEIDLGEAGDGHVPAIGLEGDVMFEQGARLGAPVQPLAELAAVRGQAAIDLPRADREHLLFHGRAQAQPAPRPGQPQRQQGLEPHGPRVAGGLPDAPQDGDHGRAIPGGSAPWWAGGAGGRAVEQPDGVLAVMAGDLTELVQDLLLLRAPGAPIPVIDHLHVLLLGSRTHDRGLHRLRKVTS